MSYIGTSRSNLVNFVKIQLWIFTILLICEILVPWIRVGTATVKTNCKLLILMDNMLIHCILHPYMSTKETYLIYYCTQLLTFFLDSTVIVNTAWLRLLSRFIDVEATRRLFQPLVSTYVCALQYPMSHTYKQ